MLEAHSIEEEATRYVLDELSPKERRRFEAQMEQSEALRAQVRQLEEGALALALACRRRQPPKELWGQIEEALSRDTHTESLRSLFRLRFWRNGWAVATACLVGWCVSVWCLHRSERLSASPAPTVATTQPAHMGSPAEPLSSRPAEPAPLAGGLDHTTAQLLRAKAEEIGALRWQVARLSNHLAQLSQALTQQQAQLSGPGHFKFFQLTPNSGAGAPTAPLSPNLQRALALAMARELGWLGPQLPGQLSGAGNSSEASANPLDASGLPAYAGTIDFVDLRFGTNRTERAQPPATEAEPQKASEFAAQTSSSGAAAAGFVSGTNTVLAFDTSVVPRGTSLSFWSTSSSGQSHSLGETTLGAPPQVVTLPMGAGDGITFTVFAVGAGGFSNVFYSSTAAGLPH